MEVGSKIVPQGRKEPCLVNPIDDEIILYTKVEHYEARLAFVGPH